MAEFTYTDASQQGYIRITGGRDHNLLKMVSAKMNFRFEYLDLVEKSQGSSMDSADNVNFTGGLGILQRGVSENIVLLIFLSALNDVLFTLLTYFLFVCSL